MPFCDDCKGKMVMAVWCECDDKSPHHALVRAFHAQFEDMGGAKQMLFEQGELWSENQLAEIAIKTIEDWMRAGRLPRRAPGHERVSRRADAQAPTASVSRD